MHPRRTRCASARPCRRRSSRSSSISRCGRRSRRTAIGRHYRTVSAWGGPEPLSNEFLFQAHQVGWRLDRARFDAMLLGKAAERATHVAAKVTDAAYDGAWSVRLDNGTNMAARFLIDATGRGAMLARQNGVAFENLDRLVGSVMLFEQATDDGVGLLIETFPDGWWYTAALPEDRRIVAAMSDADLVRSLDLNQLDGFMRALGATQHVCRAMADARPIGSPALRPAGSRHIIARHVAPAAVRRRRGLVLRSGVGAGPVQGAAVGDFRLVCGRRFPVSRRRDRPRSAIGGSSPMNSPAIARRCASTTQWSGAGPSARSGSGGWPQAWPSTLSRNSRYPDGVYGRPVEWPPSVRAKMISPQPCKISPTNTKAAMMRMIRILCRCRSRVRQFLIASALSRSP